MKNVLIAVISISFLSSCITAEFEQPQPVKEKALEEFPESIRGKYRVVFIDELSKDSAIIEIHKNYYVEPEKSQKVFISDSCVVKKYKEDMMISLKEGDQRFWTVALIHRQENGDLMIKSVYTGDNEPDHFVTELNNITAVQRVPKENNKYQYVINPDKKEIDQLIKAGLFKDVYQFIRLKE